MNTLDTREWLLTNGLGSFASGTVCDARTRTYHGWLIAALDPPSQRTLLLSHLDASLEIAGQAIPLGTNFWVDGVINPCGYQLLQSFTSEPVPTWTWGQEHWQLTRQLVMPHGIGTSYGAGEFDDSNSHCNCVLVQYCYTGREAAILRLRPLIGDRNFHHQQTEAELSFSQLVGNQRILLQAIHPEQAGTPWQLCWTEGHYQPDGMWYRNYHYPEETQRGLNDCEDLYSPGYLTVNLQPETTLALEARVGWPTSVEPYLNAQTFNQVVQAEHQRLDSHFEHLQQGAFEGQTNIRRQLLRAGDQFIAYRASIQGPTVIAGYPWFNDWGRDTLIALPGLALTTQRFSLARGLLATFGHHCQHGLIPNSFPDAGAKPFYNSIDAALWWIEILGLYLEATQDWKFLHQQYPVVQKIYKSFIAGTLYNIRVDASDGLVTWDAPGVALTWMDAVVDGQPITPRRGKPIEISALWYSALCWASRWAKQLATDTDDASEKFSKQAQRYTQHAEQVKESLQKFWNPEGYFYDTIEPDDRPDPSIRPNAVIALSLYHCGFSSQQARRVLQVASDRLLTPYGLRSLDPADPAYIGSYAGNPKHRDRAYHQGTVWSWLIGPFIRAWKRFYDPTDTEPLPLDWQPLLDHLRQQACLGSVSEIFDGDAPHLPQGAIAQAWSVGEILRHFE